MIALEYLNNQALCSSECASTVLNFDDAEDCLLNALENCREWLLFSEFPFALDYIVMYLLVHLFEIFL